MAKKKSVTKKKNIKTPCDNLKDCERFIIGETEYITLLTKKFRQRKNYESPDPNKILAYIPGTIREIYVKDGQEIEEGEPMVILEAMKMRNELTAPYKGKIKKVLVSEGQKVPRGHVIIEMD